MATYQNKETEKVSVTLAKIAMRPQMMTKG